jgi:diaminopimelate epimerase
MSRSVWKLEGCGNDFVLSLSPCSRDEILRLCDRHFGVGADGLVTLTKKDEKWRWSFYNQDGSKARFCGNAARCVALWLNQHEGQAQPRWQDEWGHEFQGREVEAGEWQVHWGLETQWELEDLSPSHKGVVEELGLNCEQVLWIQAGVPHLVVLLNQDLPDEALRLKLAKLFRPHGPEGSNVTFASTTSFQAVSFERGVEAETLACGSGASAASLAYFERFRRWPGWSFPGGPLRLVEDQSQLWLQGPARIVFEAKIP